MNSLSERIPREDLRVGENFVLIILLLIRMVLMIILELFHWTIYLIYMPFLLLQNFITESSLKLIYLCLIKSQLKGYLH